jgi:hypothetical protein
VAADQLFRVTRVRFNRGRHSDLCEDFSCRPAGHGNKRTCWGFDKRVRTDVAGFATDSWRHFFALPLKRWWRKNWFQPIARIGKVGNSEHVLQPAAPLTAMLLLTEEKEKKCNRPRPQKDEREKYISSPVSEEFRTWELDGEAANNIQPNRMLNSDITADATGELFLYVNDAVLSLPASMNIFYQNNIGTAKVTVARILADSIETPANENKVQTMIEH